MSSQPQRHITPEQYLDQERQAETKSEYLAGTVVAMTGASEAHNLIVANVISELRAQLKGKPCKVYPSDMRIKVSPTGLYTYPDVTVVCGETHFDDEHKDTLLNPTLLVEVLSPTTADYDRGGKFAHYRKLSFLHEYVLIAQDTPHIEHYVRQEANQWLLSEIEDLQGSIHLPAIDCRLSLAEVYDKVTL